MNQHRDVVLLMKNIPPDYKKDIDRVNMKNHLEGFHLDQLLESRNLISLENALLNNSPFAALFDGGSKINNYTILSLLQQLSKSKDILKFHEWITLGLLEIDTTKPLVRVYLPNILYSLITNVHNSHSYEANQIFHVANSLLVDLSLNK